MSSHRILERTHTGEIVTNTQYEKKKKKKKRFSCFQSPYICLVAHRVIFPLYIKK